MPKKSTSLPNETFAVPIGDLEAEAPDAVRRIVGAPNEPNGPARRTATGEPIVFAGDHAPVDAHVHRVGAGRARRSRRRCARGTRDSLDPLDSLRAGRARGARDADRAGRTGGAGGSGRNGRGDRQSLSARRQGDVRARRESQVTRLSVQAVDDSHRRVVTVRVQNDVGARNAERHRDAAGGAQRDHGCICDGLTRHEVERGDRRECSALRPEHEEPGTGGVHDRGVQGDRLGVRGNVADARERVAARRRGRQEASGQRGAVAAGIDETTGRHGDEGKGKRAGDLRLPPGREGRSRPLCR